MTPNEINTWLDQHCAAFPAFASWLDGLRDDVRRPMLEQWRESFARKKVTLAAALDASTDMMDNGGHPYPDRFDQLATAIIKRCRPPETCHQGPPLQFADEPRYRCLDCRDSGLVSVFDSGTVAAAKTDAWKQQARAYIAWAKQLRESSASMGNSPSRAHLPGHLMPAPLAPQCKTVVTICSCAAGELKAEGESVRKFNPRTARYKEQFCIGGRCAADFERLLEWIDKPRVAEWEPEKAYGEVF